MANTSILAAFERMWQHVVAKLGDKANLDHTHDDRYYTEAEVDSKVSEVDTAVTNIVNGTTIVPKSVRATSADSATSATKATQDASGNVITSTYETKSDATAKLSEAKSYTDIEIDKLSDTVAFIDSTDNESVSDANNTLTTAHIVDGLNSSSSSMVLSAKQGKVLNERINTLTSLEEELEDARIDKDGNTHDNVGEHIRNVTSQLSDEIGDSVADWNQNDETALDYVKNRTHYDSRRTEEVVYEFDGVLEGKEYIDLSYNQYYIKVSSEVPTNINNLKEVSITLQTPDGSETFITEVYQISDNLYGDEDGLITVAYEDIVSDDMPPFTKGIYFIAGSDGTDIVFYVQKLLCNIIISGELKELDEKYISYKPGLKVGGKEFTIGEESVVAAPGAEIFNDYNNKATGYYSHAEGANTTASGVYSHAEGSHTTASGDCSHAEGYNTTASGYYSHAEGYNTTASGYYSHAEGANTTASGVCSHAEGYNTTASGVCSHAEGYNTTASSNNQHVQGKYNIEDTENKYAHIVGNGDFNNNNPIYSNAHTLDWQGNGWYAGSVEATAIILNSSTEGSTKRFKIIVDDTGNLTATEITE